MPLKQNICDFLHIISSMLHISQFVIHYIITKSGWCSMENFGYIRIKLDDLLKSKNISKNKLCHLAQMERSQINKYYRNEVTRLDTAVLARLCTALDCELSDLLEFVPAEKME